MGQNDNPYVNKIDSINAQFLDGANLSVDTTLGGAYPEDEKIPSEKAVKTYIDNAVTGGITVDHATLSNKSYANSGHTGFKKANIRMNVAPTVNDDILSGYENDDIWHDVVGDRMYVCKDNTAGAAVWKEIVTQDSTVLDSRYYTETEVDTLLDDYSPTADLYTATQLDNGQLDTRYYTETEINDRLAVPGDIKATIRTIPPSGWLLCDGSAISRTTYADLFSAVPVRTSTVTMTIASPGVVTWTAHGLSTGHSIQFSTTGALPTGITAGTVYYVRYVTDNTFHLYDTFANATNTGATTGIVNTSGSQSGTHTATSYLYGNGDGSTTFNIPNGQGLTLKGAGSQSIGGRAKSAGALGTVLEDQMQGHHHVNEANHVAWTPDTCSTANRGIIMSQSSCGEKTNMIRRPAADETNGTPRTGTTTRDSSLAVNYIIKY